MQSISTISSEEGNTTEYPCSSQRSTLESNQDIVERLQAINIVPTESVDGKKQNDNIVDQLKRRERIDDQDEDGSDDTTLQNDLSIVDVPNSNLLPFMTGILE